MPDGYVIIYKPSPPAMFHPPSSTLFAPKPLINCCSWQINANRTSTTTTQTIIIFNAPAPSDFSCGGNPGLQQQQVRGDIQQDPFGFIVSDSTAGSAEECYNICSQSPGSVSYAFEDRSSRLCRCFSSPLYFILINNPNGRFVLLIRMEEINDSRQ